MCAIMCVVQVVLLDVFGVYVLGDGCVCVVVMRMCVLCICSYAYI